MFQVTVGAAAQLDTVARVLRFDWMAAAAAAATFITDMCPKDFAARNYSEVGTDVVIDDAYKESRSY